MFHHARAFAYSLVVKHLSSQRYTAYWCLQLVCHIVDEIILYLRISFLSEYYEYCEDESNEQYKRKYNRWYHETHTTEYVLVHIREVYLYYSFLVVRVISEQ